MIEAIEPYTPEEKAALIAAIDLEALEREMMELPQVECPVFHHFGPGVCIRERHMPEGTLLLGHRHRVPNLNMIVEGAVVVVANGDIGVLFAPYIFVGEPERKLIYALKDTVWINVIQTDLTDVEAIEAAFIEKSQPVLEHTP